MRRVVLYLMTVYASVPVILYLFPWILGHIVFSHFCKYSLFDHYQINAFKCETFLNFFSIVFEQCGYLQWTRLTTVF